MAKHFKKSIEIYSGSSPGADIVRSTFWPASWTLVVCGSVFLPLLWPAAAIFPLP
jgi:hypothetical protein